MQRAEEGIHEYRKRSVKLGVRVTVLSFLLLFMVVFMLWNTSLLSRALNQSTEQYVEDVSQGLARDLSYRMEADAIKLDRQFFGEIQKLRTKRVIASLIQMAHDLGMEVVAEGIETPEQLEFLRIHHCDLVQGFIFSGPLTASDFWEAERF